MIDFLPILRQFILDDPDLTTHLASLNGSKNIFTRRPIPEAADYQLIIINPPSADLDRDFLDKAFRDVTHNIIVYGNNDNSENYRKVDETAFKLKNRFLRLTSAEMTLPSGYSFVRANSIGPFSAPTDDLTKVAKAVSVTISYMEE